MSTNDCTINIPPPAPLTSSPSSMSLSTPCSTTMKVAGLTPFQSFLLRPADTRSVIVFIVACIGTFFILLHVKKVVDSFSPPSSETVSRSHMASPLSITPSPTPTAPQIPILHTIIPFNTDIIPETAEDGTLLYPLTQYIPQLSSYQILSLHSLTITSTSTSPSHYHTTMSELLILQHGSIQIRLIDATTGHIEDVMLSVDETQDHPIGILIYPNACHTWNPIPQQQSSDSSSARMLSYSLRPITTSSSSDPMKLLLSDRHTCPLSGIQYTQRDMIAVKSNYDTK